MASIRNDLEPVCSFCGERVVLGMIEERECAVCHKKTYTKEVCVNGHYVCDECRRKKASKSIIEHCLSSKSRDPVQIAVEIMNDDSVFMHDQKHHVIVGSALLTAYHNCGGDIDLEQSLREMDKRGSWFPGGICGFAGTCGAAASAGAFYSIVTGTTPHSGRTWSDTNMLVSECLAKIASIEGPRCCKRNSFLVMGVTADYVNEKLGIKMDIAEKILCPFKSRNEECIKDRCPFYE
jgi:hypothetical protein